MCYKNLKTQFIKKKKKNRKLRLFEKKKKGETKSKQQNYFKQFTNASHMCGCFVVDTKLT